MLSLGLVKVTVALLVSKLMPTTIKNGSPLHPFANREDACYAGHPSNTKSGCKLLGLGKGHHNILECLNFLVRPLTKNAVL